MAFTHAETLDIRHYIGLPADEWTSADLTWRSLDGATEGLTPEMEARVRGFLASLRSLETRMVDAVGCANVVQLDGAKFDPELQLRLIRQQGRRLVHSMASWLDVRVHRTPFDGDAASYRTHRGG